MSAQQGTLNIVGDAAFLVLSLPVSAFQGVDDDGDGAMSKTEFAGHVSEVRAQVQAGVQLLGSSAALPLQVVMVEGEPPDSAPTTDARQLTVLGRFGLQHPGAALGRPGASAAPSSDGLSLRFTLFGSKVEEQQHDLTITRRQDTQWLRFTPERPTQSLLPSTVSILASYVQTGATHVLTGADHLLFLLVVLSAGWGWRALIGVLTCFTAGHAITLVACVLGGWSVAARIVEPAIAATIVGLSALDAWGRRRDRPASFPVRLGLVSASSLVHGLGLAGALTAMTQWPAGSSPMLWSLAGFNLGIELAQVLVAVVAALLVWGLRRLGSPGLVDRARPFVSSVAMAVGVVWLVERLVQ